MGISQTTPRSQFFVSGISNATHIAAGQEHACAALEDSTVKCWGDDTYGQLGNDVAQADQSTPVAVSGISNAVRIVTGYQHSCALLADQTVKCWGNDTVNQLGNGAGASTNCSGNPCEPVPVAVKDIAGTGTLGNVTAISSNQGGHVCVVLSDSTINCWGDDDGGKLGDDLVEQGKSLPVVVSGITTATSVSVGGALTCALLADATGKCWGNDANGSLGDDANLVNQPTPVSIATISGISRLEVGWAHACALLTNGAFYCWGEDGSWQLGDDSNLTDRATPVLIEAVTDAQEISLGTALSCILTTDAYAKCWGGNTQGEAGKGVGVNVPWAPDGVIGL